MKEAQSSSLTDRALRPEQQLGLIDKDADHMNAANTMSEEDKASREDHAEDNI